MKTGIIVRRTPAHLDPARLRACSFVAVEPDAWVRSLGAGDAPQYIPVVSAFLGSKTLPVKRDETEYLHSRGAKTIVYFLDSRNFKYGDLGAFREEVRLLEQSAQDTEVILYTAVENLSAQELDILTTHVAATRFSLMLGFGGSERTRGRPEDTIRRVTATIPAHRLACAFWAEDELAEALPSLRDMGIQWVAALV
jgi:hypothetical protein